MSYEGEFDQIVGCEFFSGELDKDIPEIPEQCRNCEVLGSFAAEIRRLQTAKDASMKLGALATEEPRNESGDTTAEDPPAWSRDGDIAKFMMRVQDAGIEGASTAIDAWKKAMEDTIVACSSGVVELSGTMNGVTYTRTVCTSDMQIHDPGFHK